MAGILDRYGIKEVADVTFYKLDGSGTPTVPVLYLDTLKVSTIEQTAETSDATGGKGNAKLITWDYGKEITVTLEDALFSAKSMAIMFGNGYVKNLNTNDSAYIMKTEIFTATSNTAATSTALKDAGWSTVYTAPDGKTYTKNNPKFYAADAERGVGGETYSALASVTAGEKYFCTYDLEASGAVIEVSANSFPGTYYVTGDTYARNEASGDDEFFQFIIPKAKVTSENTITLEAEGDPSVFNMNLTVLRPADGVMMRLVKYELTNGSATSSEPATVDLVHNHTLLPPTSESD